MQRRAMVAVMEANAAVNCRIHNRQRDKHGFIWLRSGDQRGQEWWNKQRRVPARSNFRKQILCPSVQHPQQNPDRWRQQVRAQTEIINVAETVQVDSGPYNPEQEESQWQPAALGRKRSGWPGAGENIRQSEERRKQQQPGVLIGLVSGAPGWFSADLVLVEHSIDSRQRDIHHKYHEAGLEQTSGEIELGDEPLQAAEAGNGNGA